MRVANNTEWLFFHLWKRDPETSLPCPNLYLAETILFRWAQPYFWYYTAKDGTLVRKTKEKVILPHVEEAFQNNMAKCGVIATCLNSMEDTNLKTQEKIEFDYIEQSAFHNFLFQKEKPMNLILQKFIEPKNNKNALIKVSWTPQFCIFFRKTNINELNNSKVPLLNRLTTFEGPEHFSTSDSVSTPILTSELEQTCLNIVKHIQSVTSGNIQISKMVLYFKLDERNRLWLLFCTGLKFRDKGSPSSRAAAKKKNERPMSPILTVVAKKDEKTLKPQPTQQYLLEDQVNELNAEVCLRCSTEGLLYDLKMKLLLDYEEMTIKEQGEEEDFETFSEAFKKNEDKPKGSSAKVPEVMKKLYPNIVDEKYIKLKTNTNFMSMPIKLCETCYLEVTENVIENNEERRLKSMKSMKLSDKSPRSDRLFGSQGFMSESTSPKTKLGASPLMRSSTQDALSPSKRFGQSQRTSRMLSQIVNQNEIKEENVGSNEEIKLSLHKAQSVNSRMTEEKPKSYLPVLESPRSQDEEQQAPFPHTVSKVKERYFKITNNHYHLDTRPKTPNQNSLISPYALEMSIAPKTQRVNTTANKSPRAVVVVKRAKPNTKPLDQASKLPKLKVWSQSTKNVTRTNFSSMMSTIKDLKALIGQNLESIE